MADINSTSSNELGCIASNLPLKVMRIAMENKGLFSGQIAPGALYCFTGNTQDVTVTMEDGTSVIYTVPVTIAINGPSDLNANTIYGIQFSLDNNNKVNGGTLVPITNN